MQAIKKTSQPIISEILLGNEKLKFCYDCGICTASCPMVELVGREYNPRVMFKSSILEPRSLMFSNGLWLCAWCYRCFYSCPQGQNLPEIFFNLKVAAVEQGSTQALEDALQKIVENVPLPLVTTLVCFHPERVGLDLKEIISKIESMRDEFLKSETRDDVKISLGRVAVIGSGPAGLTVSYELGRKGYAVEVFESLHESGGMLRKCIPLDKLPSQVLEKELNIIESLGVDIKKGVSIGLDMSFEDLMNVGYDAVFIGVGAHKCRHVSIEGKDLDGVSHALDYLWAVNSGEKIRQGKNVIVIGGGNVAVDAAKTCLRLGAKNVAIFYRRSRGEMPAIPWEVREAEEEGIKIEFLVSPVKILGQAGEVSSLRCIRMELGELDETGRRKPIPIEGSEFESDTDMVIMATGEVPDLNFLPREVQLEEDGTIWVNPITMETSLPGVFAGGDAVTGPATVIEAIRAGKCAAKSIESYVKSLR